MVEKVRDNFIYLLNNFGVRQFIQRIIPHGESHARTVNARRRMVQDVDGGRANPASSLSSSWIAALGPPLQNMRLALQGLGRMDHASDGQRSIQIQSSF